jgi:hypothetical protein
MRESHRVPGGAAGLSWLQVKGWRSGCFRCFRCCVCLRWVPQISCASQACQTVNRRSPAPARSRAWLHHARHSLHRCARASLACLHLQHWQHRPQERPDGLSIYLDTSRQRSCTSRCRYRHIDTCLARRRRRGPIVSTRQGRRQEGGDFTNFRSRAGGRAPPEPARTLGRFASTPSTLAITAYHHPHPRSPRTSPPCTLGHAATFSPLPPHPHPTLRASTPISQSLLAYSLSPMTS